MTADPTTRVIDARSAAQPRLGVLRRRAFGRLERIALAATQETRMSPVLETVATAPSASTCTSIAAAPAAVAPSTETTSSVSV